MLSFVIEIKTRMVVHQNMTGRKIYHKANYTAMKKALPEDWDSIITSSDPEVNLTRFSDILLEVVKRHTPKMTGLAAEKAT